MPLLALCSGPPRRRSDDLLAKAPHPRRHREPGAAESPTTRGCTVLPPVRAGKEPPFQTEPEMLQLIEHPGDDDTPPRGSW